MQCYTNSLNKSPPNTHRVQKCLQKLLRSMHKDRHHTIQHYKHLLETNMEQADREKEITIEHLADIDRFECFATVFKDELDIGTFIVFQTFSWHLPFLDSNNLYNNLTLLIVQNLKF